jgi:hypothetical protein
MHPNVENIFVVYYPGFAGNFILRLLTLSENVMPTMTKKMLTEWSESTIKPDVDLHSQYSFDTVQKDHNGEWLSFHDAWAGIYEHSLYASLIDLGEPYSKIVYQIHPHEFLKFENNIEALPQKTMLYVDLDLGKYGEWLRRESARIGCKPRGDEYTQGAHLKEKYGMYVVNLTAILDSTDGFVAEYIKLCDRLNIQPVINKATALYENWKKHRVTNDSSIKTTN